jgi:predicted ATP-dependent endonuclease of OLD family
MKLIRFKVGGFKNIKEIDVNLTKTNALIALNNFGKSNVMDALRFGLHFIGATDKRKAMASNDVIPINKHMDSIPFFLEIEAEIETSGKKFNAIYSYSFEWIKDKTDEGQFIKLESLKIKSKGDKKHKEHIRRDSADTTYIASETARCVTKLDIEKDELAINKLVYQDSLYYIDILKQIKELKFMIVDTLENPEDVFRRIPVRINDEPIVRTGYSVGFMDSFDVPYFIYSLRKINPNLYILFKNSVLDLIPSIEDFELVEINLKELYEQALQENKEKNIPVELPEKYHRIGVKQRNNNQITDIKTLSTGSLKLFTLLARTIAAELNKIPLIGFEEVENSIHPALLQRLLIVLDELTKNTKIIFSSHSPYLVQYLELKNVFIGVPNDEDLAVFKKIKPSKIKKLEEIAQDEGISMGDVLFNMMIDASCGNNSIDPFLDE